MLGVGFVTRRALPSLFVARRIVNCRLFSTTVDWKAMMTSLKQVTDHGQFQSGICEVIRVLELEQNPAQVDYAAEKAFEELFTNERFLQDCSTTPEYATQYLKLLKVSQERNMILSRHNSSRVLTTMIQLLQQYHDHADIAKEGSLCVRYLARMPRFRQDLLPLGIIPLLLQQCTAYSTNESTLNEAYRALYNLTLDSECSQELLKHTGGLAILSTAATGGNGASTTSSELACSIVANMAGHPGLQETQVDDLLKVLRAVGAKNSQILTALWNLSVHNLAILSPSQVSTCLELCVQALQGYGSHADAAKQGGGFLCTFSDNEEYAMISAQNGGISVLFSLLTSHPTHSEIIQLSSRALWNLFCAINSNASESESECDILDIESSSVSSSSSGSNAVLKFASLPQLRSGLLAVLACIEAQLDGASARNAIAVNEGAKEASKHDFELLGEVTGVLWVVMMVEDLHKEVTSSHIALLLRLLSTCQGTVVGALEEHDGEDAARDDGVNTLIRGYGTLCNLSGGPVGVGFCQTYCHAGGLEVVMESVKAFARADVMTTQLLFVVLGFVQNLTFEVAIAERLKSSGLLPILQTILQTPSASQEVLAQAHGILFRLAGHNLLTWTELMGPSGDSISSSSSSSSSTASLLEGVQAAIQAYAGISCADLGRKVIATCSKAAGVSLAPPPEDE